MLCSKCGASLPDGAIYCYSCGEYQNKSQAENVEATQTIKVETEIPEITAEKTEQNSKTEEPKSQYFTSSYFNRTELIKKFKNEVDTVFVISILSIFMSGIAGIVCAIAVLLRAKSILPPQIFGTIEDTNEIEKSESRLKISKTLAIVGLILSVIAIIAVIAYYVAILTVIILDMSAI